MRIDQITDEVLRLNSKDRAMLARTLWESFDDPYLLSSPMADEEALTLSIQRDKQLERGEVIPLSHVELMARLRR